MLALSGEMLRELGRMLNSVGRDARLPQHVENLMVGRNARRYGTGFLESSCTGRAKCSMTRSSDIFGSGEMSPVDEVRSPHSAAASVRFPTSRQLVFTTVESDARPLRPNGATGG